MVKCIQCSYGITSLDLVMICFVHRYVAPEYALSGMLTEKSDVYSYGVLLMEVVTGRTPVDFRRDAGEVQKELYSALFLPF